MAKGHNDDGAEKEQTTDAESGKGQTSRRTFVKTVGAAVALGGSASLFGRASAVSDLDAALNPSGEVTLDAGEYSWSGGMDIGAGDACVGGGSKGDTVLNLESGTMDGSVEGRLENVVVRGANPEPKAGIDLSPGATLDGFVWPEGGRQSEDRAFYTPDGGNDRLTIRNSAWARMANNGAYVDKPPVTMENCVAVNNNIAGVRVGHRDGTDTSETTYVRNTLIAVTDSIPSDDTNSPNARGLRLRSPANLVVENCWFVYFDVDGNADLVELHDGAAGSTVTIRNCKFYNDSDGDLVRDKSDGEMDVTIENCTVAGSGSRTVEPDFSGSGVSEVDDLSVPVPSQITGYAAADEIEGLDLSVAPWDGSASAPTQPDDEEEQTQTDERTLVLHASPENAGNVDVSFTVDGSVAFAAEAEPDTDTIEENGDGTVTATSVGLDPDALDSYRFSGSVVDATLPSSGSVDVSVDGNTTTFEDLVGGEDDDSSGSDGDSDDSTDGSTGGDSDDSTDGSTGGDSDDSSGDDSSGGSGSESLPHLLTVDGDDDVTTYTFTVSGDVARDANESVATSDGTTWDDIEDIAKDGKVIGLVGSGTDAYRFGGSVTEITVDGDATVAIERNA